MLASVFEQFWREERRVLTVWVVVVGGAALAVLLLYDVLLRFPGLLFAALNAVRLFDDQGVVYTAKGWLDVVALGAVMPWLVSVYAVLMGRRLIGDEYGGMLTLLLAYPYPRWQLLLARWLVMAAGVLLLAVTAGAVMVVWGTAHQLLVMPLLLAAARLGCFGLVWGNLAAAVSVVLGSPRWGGFVGFLGLGLTYALTWASNELAGWQGLRTSTLHWLLIDGNALHGWGLAVLFLFAALLLGVALYGFERRDLAG